jgi:hypothetical protein
MWLFRTPCQSITLTIHFGHPSSSTCVLTHGQKTEMICRTLTTLARKEQPRHAHVFQMTPCAKIGTDNSMESGTKTSTGSQERQEVRLDTPMCNFSAFQMDMSKPCLSLRRIGRLPIICGAFVRTDCFTNENTSLPFALCPAMRTEGSELPGAETRRKNLQDT